MKTKGILLTIGLTVLSLTAFSQKTSQTDLPNEFYAGYGAGSLFYFTGLSNQSHHHMYSYGSDTYLRSAGTFLLGYTRNLNRVVSMGVIFSYMPANSDFTDYSYDKPGNGSNEITGSASDNILGAITRITFSYVSKPAFRIYSGIAIGVTVDCGTVTYNGNTVSRRKLYPAGEITLFGVRFGRALGGFVEMGFGTNGIITAGISYKIND